MVTPLTTDQTVHLSRRLAWVVFALAIVLAPGLSAQTKHKPANAKWTKGAPYVSFDVSSLATPKVRKELGDGLRKRFVVSVDARVEGSHARIATRQFECGVTYDLWEDGYLIRIGRITERAPTLDAVIKRCLKVKELGVGLGGVYDRHRGRPIYFKVQAYFNPISKAQCRDLVRSGGGAGSDPIGPIAVNIVRRRVCTPEAAVEFRTESVPVPPK